MLKHEITPVLAVHRREIPHTRRLAPRAPAHHKLMWAPAGTLAIQADGNDWVVPPTHALWVPAGLMHGARALRPGAVYRIRIDRADSPVQWTRPTSVVVGPLMRELIVFLGREDPSRRARRDAELLLLDLLESAPLDAVHVPLPYDGRARAIAEGLIERPDDDRDLGAWGSEVGASTRTLARLFSAETGMTFRQWRTQVRMRAALGLLADGQPVANVAGQVGYRTPSAFAAAFRRATGRTPRASRRA